MWNNLQHEQEHEPRKIKPKSNQPPETPFIINPPCRCRKKKKTFVFYSPKATQ